MPPIIIVFWALFGLGVAPQLVHGLDPRSDPMARSKGLHKKEPTAYRTWTSSPTRTATGCTFTVFALVTRGKVVFQVNGTSVDPDTSIWWVRTIPLGTQFTDHVVFFSLDGKRVAEQNVADTCWILNGDPW